MKPISEELSRYKSVYAASAATGVKAAQLHRLIDKGALVEPDGTIWIKSKTKLKNGGVRAMTLAQAIYILKTHNEWRRGGSSEFVMVDPTELGIAIDLIIECMERMK